MLSESDLNGPAQLCYEKAAPRLDDGELDWSKAQSFPSLREALHWVMTAQAPAGQEAFIRAASGRVLRPDIIEELWASVQGP